MINCEAILRSSSGSKSLAVSKSIGASAGYLSLAIANNLSTAFWFSKSDAAERISSLIFTSTAYPSPSFTAVYSISPKYGCASN